MCLIISKKKCLVFCIVFIMAGLVSAVLADFIGVERKICVVVDAGHGLPDGGALGVNGSIEADLNLDIAKKLCEVLNAKGIKTVMTRSSQYGIKETEGEDWSKLRDMKLRLKILREADADLFLSIHMNHFSSPSVSGLRLFYAENHAEIKPLAEDIQNKMSELTGAKITSVRAADKGLFLMKSPPVPAILIECGFLSNPEEERKLSEEEYRAKIAWAISESVESYFMTK